MDLSSIVLMYASAFCLFSSSTAVFCRNRRRVWSRMASSGCPRGKLRQIALSSAGYSRTLCSGRRSMSEKVRPLQRGLDSADYRKKGRINEKKKESV